MSSSIETVLRELESVGFQRLQMPLDVGGITFDFDAAVTGTGVSHDLVVVEGVGTDPHQVAQRLAGLNRSLDRMRSRRPVSLILLGSRPSGDALSELEKKARVMAVESEQPTREEIHSAIAVLLPLQLPPTTQEAIDPLDQLADELGKDCTVEHQQLIDAARRGPKFVRETLRSLLDDALQPVSSEEASA